MLQCTCNAADELGNAVADDAVQRLVYSGCRDKSGQKPSSNMYKTEVQDTGLQGLIMRSRNMLKARISEVLYTGVAESVKRHRAELHVVMVHLCNAAQAGGESLKSAVELVAKLQDPNLTDQLMQHLQGHQPGAVSLSALHTGAGADQSTYLVLLYMALGRHEEAADVALGLARTLQEAGNYKVSVARQCCDALQHRCTKL